MAVLSDKRLVIVSGKGGVGKSTVSAALALRFCRAGLRTLVCEVNAKERVSQLLGLTEAGPRVTKLEENLWAANVRPDEAMREYALMILKFQSIYNAVFENRLVRYFLHFIPSLAELVMLGKILFHVREKEGEHFRFDRVVLDAPATGHALTFLSVPQVILDTVPPGALARDATWMRDLLVDPATTAAVLVSLPEEMPVNETLELATALRTKVNVRPGAVVLNGVFSQRFDDRELAALAPHPSLATLAQGHHQRARLSLECHDKLASRLGLPVYSVPRLFLPAFGRPAVEEVARHLAPLTDGAP
ncbi:MAG: ArsA family ATPase [Myxococcota bacterium]